MISVISAAYERRQLKHSSKISHEERLKSGRVVAIRGNSEPVVGSNFQDDLPTVAAVDFQSENARISRDSGDVSGMFLQTRAT